MNNKQSLGRGDRGNEPFQGEIKSNCVRETLTQISKLTAFVKKFRPLPNRERVAGVSEQQASFTPAGEGTTYVDMLVDTQKILPISRKSRHSLFLHFVSELGNKVQYMTSHGTRTKSGSAFTLAEVLITLGIIGVVAAMTLPALIQNKTHKELETALKKNYSNIQNALNLMSHDYGETIGQNTLTTREIKPLFMKYFKVAKDCGRFSCVGHDGNADEDGTIYLSKKYRNYNNTNFIGSDYIDGGQFILQDGSMIFIEMSAASSASNSSFWIIVDVNGFKKGPNRWGHDLFTFQVMGNGKLLPMGADGTQLRREQYCSSTSTSTINGAGCTYSALTDKDYWKNLPK